MGFEVSNPQKHIARNKEIHVLFSHVKYVRPGIWGTIGPSLRLGMQYLL